MNIAEKLKSCQTGMKLYSPVYGEMQFVCINKYNEKYPIVCKDKIEYAISFTRDGKIYYNYPNAECVLFPSKTQRDWNKFRIPIKKGDIMMKIDGTSPFIATGEMYHDISPKYICGINLLGDLQIGLNKGGWTSTFYIPASKEAKKELFDKMEEVGYKWNAESLKLEKIESKYRPFINREECLQEMLKHKPYGWVKADYGQSIITEIRNSKATIGRNDRLLDFDYIFSKYKFADGTPFGIREE